MSKGIALWLNSTPGRLLLLNRRAKKLTYPSWSTNHWKEIRIPRPNNPAWISLKAAFDQVSETELLPMKHADNCEARRVIDEAVAIALGH